MTTIPANAVLFVDAIFTSFDSLYFQRGIHADVTEDNQLKDTLPADMQKLIFDRSLSISHWIVATGILSTKEMSADRKKAVNASARTFLIRMKQKPGRAGTEKDQLISFIFTKVYSTAKPVSKEKLINLVNPCEDVLTSSTSRLKRNWIKIQLLATKVMANQVVKIAAAIATIYLVATIVSVAKPIFLTLATTYAVRLIVNPVINYAPIVVARGLGHIVAAISYIFNHQTRLFFGEMFLGFSLRNYPRIRQFKDKVFTVLLFPTTLSAFIFDKILNAGFASYRAQTQIANSLKDYSDRKKAEFLEVEGTKAHLVWMELMCRA